MNAALIVAAGSGTRMGPNVDKMFLEINRHPVISYTWRKFDQSAEIDEVILVVREGMQTAFEEIGKKYRFRKSYRLVAGGKERQNSVWNGLQALSPGTEIVAVQDGARPCTSHSLISATIAAAQQTGAAVAAQAVTDTVKESRDGGLVERTLDRSRLWTVQTPQTFKLSVIRRALEEVLKKGLLVTDDTAACELIDQPIQLVISNHPNPKVTRPEDLPYVEFLLQAEKPALAEVR